MTSLKNEAQHVEGMLLSQWLSQENVHQIQVLIRVGLVSSLFYELHFSTFFFLVFNDTIPTPRSVIYLLPLIVYRCEARSLTLR
jgi:hypothetical protein